jgi:hypothetical protein
MRVPSCLLVRPSLIRIVLLLSLLGGLSVAVAQEWAMEERPSPFQPADAGRLRPGQYRWAADRWSSLPVRVVIDLAGQRGYVFQGRALVGITTVSTGRRGHSTPAGTYPILQKARWHRSNIYANAPMPFMQRLTWGGIALHAGNVYGYRRSHGCIRLPAGFAKLLFGLTELGAIVSVANGIPPLEAPRFEIVMATTDQSVASMTAAML